MKKIVLASKSPRRKELLENLGYEFEISVSDKDEIIKEGLDYSDVVIDLAYQKGLNVLENKEEYKDYIILSFDTIVVVENKILGKPKNFDDCVNMMNLLNDKTHQVYTGCAIIEGENIEKFYSVADVTFNKMTEKEIIDYANTLEPYDKAGGYAVQGYAARFIEKINGDYFTIVGMPVNKVYQYLKKYE